MNMLTTGLKLSADSSIDLHMHTTYSDGRWILGDLFDHLLHEHFGLVSITDHDRADTVDTIQQLACERQLPVLVGAEMSTTWKGEMVDLLCYGFDASKGALNHLAQDLLHRQQENTREVFENLQRKGYTLPPDVLSILIDRPSSEQPHALVAALKDYGHGVGEPSAGKLVMESGCSFEMNEPAAVVEAAHRDGGVCLLAHPGRGDGFVNYDVQLLDQFREEAPIDGLEVYYPLHTPVKTELYLDYVKRHHLLISAGSDSHRADKPPIKYRADLCQGLLERVGIKIM